MTARFFAPCPSGIESLLAEELRRIGMRSVRPQRSGVLFAGSLADGARAVFWSRLATRVLLTLAEVDATTADALYASVRNLPWEDHVRAGGTIAVDAGGTNESLRNTQFTAVKVKDAIVDRFRDRLGRRPSVDVRQPDLRVNVAVRGNKATISVDLAGEPLHRRGYREPGVQVEAPMKETMAAAVVEACGWRRIAQDGGAFVDPMCGSATLAIEAALAAADIAPGLLRHERPIERWLGFDSHAWAQMRDDAEKRREAGLRALPPVLASDADKRAVEIARRCLQRASLSGVVRVEQRELSAVLPPPDSSRGLVCTNPPWGERLSESSALPVLYAQLAERLRGPFLDWTCGVVSPDPVMRRSLGIEPKWSKVLGTGKGSVTLTLFDSTSKRLEGGGQVPAQPTDGRPARPVALDSVAADEFSNRLAKTARHVGKWARRSDVTCYRVYDADLPEFALAIDLYAGAGPDEGRRWVHVAEYAAPAEVDPGLAAARLDAAVARIPKILDVGADDVFVKRRERMRGSAQYERLGRNGVTGVIAEGGLLFEVNFSDYLDTGIFLDHRPTRALIRELAKGKRFLNLFAYTGTATTYAAGDARETTTVDLSATYTSWARRNLELNGLGDPARNRTVQADVRSWLASSAGEESFDIVFCDPPTFSNSKRMEGTFDVQRDHGALIASIEGVLAEDGVLIFSCNRSSFSLDEHAVHEAGLAARDITASTVPKDFERTPRVHRCWEIRRSQ